MQATRTTLDHRHERITLDNDRLLDDFDSASDEQLDRALLAYREALDCFRNR